MNKVTVPEAKKYLGLDGEEQDKLLASFIDTAEHIVEKALREPITEETPNVAKTAILYIIWQLYFHRDNAEFKVSEIETTVAIMLSDIRKVEF